MAGESELVGAGQSSSALPMVHKNKAISNIGSYIDRRI